MYNLTNANHEIESATSKINTNIKEYYANMGLSSDVSDMESIGAHGQMNNKISLCL